MSPSDIEVLIHCHACPGAHPRIEAPAVKEALQMFQAMKLIEPSGNAFVTTEKGRAFIKIICNTPPPTSCMVWVDVNGNTIRNIGGES